jgi:hypothetical protein
MRIKPPKRRKRASWPIRAAVQILVIILSILIALMFNDMRRNRAENEMAGNALLAMRYEIKQNIQQLSLCSPSDTNLWVASSLPVGSSEAYIMLQNVGYAPQNRWIYKSPIWQTSAYEVGYNTLESISSEVKIQLHLCYTLQKQLAEQQQNIRYNLLMASAENARIIAPLVMEQWNAYLNTRKALMKAQSLSIKKIDELQIEE